MGMDVVGRNPKNETGKYFRASVWSWAPIYTLMCELCNDIIPESTLRNMTYNEGAGPKSARVCKEMANRFSQWMEHNTEGKVIPSKIKINSTGVLQFISNTPTLDNSAFSVSDEHLQKWVDFLRNCGGFQVF